MFLSVKFYYYFSKQLFPSLPIVSLFCEIFCFPTLSPGLGIFIFQNEKFNRAKYLEANSFSFSLNL